MNTYIEVVVSLVLGPVQAGDVPDLAPEHDGVPGGALLPHLSARFRALRRVRRLRGFLAAGREQLLTVLSANIIS